LARNFQEIVEIVDICTANFAKMVQDEKPVPESYFVLTAVFGSDILSRGYRGDYGDLTHF
jgi:hypothetical protein